MPQQLFRSVTLLALALFLGTGCIGPTKTRGRAIGGITAGVGALMMIDGLTSDCHLEEGGGFGEAFSCGIEQEVVPYMGGVLVAIGAAILLVNELAVDPEPEAAAEVRVGVGVSVGAGGTAGAVAAPPPVAAEPLPQPQTDDPMLRRLTLQASVAARTGSCTTVSAIASRVAELDAAYRQSAFQSDAKIAACLRD